MNHGEFASEPGIILSYLHDVDIGQYDPRFLIIMDIAHNSKNHLYWEYRLEKFRGYGLWYLHLINAKISILKTMEIGQYDPQPTMYTVPGIYFLEVRS